MLFRTGSLFGLLLVFTVSALGTGQAADAPKIRTTYIGGTSSFIMTILAERIAKNYNLNVVRDRVPSPPGLYTKIKTGEYDTALGAWVTIGILRNQGSKVDAGLFHGRC